MNSVYSRFEPSDTGLLKSIKALTHKENESTIVKTSAQITEASRAVITSPAIETNELVCDILDIAANISLLATVTIRYQAECRGCGRVYELDIDCIDDFDPSASYCNGSERCVP